MLERLCEAPDEWSLYCAEEVAQMAWLTLRSSSARIGNIFPSLFPGQRQDFVFTPMVVIGKVMHLTIEKFATSLTLGKKESLQVKGHGKLTVALRAVRRQDQVDLRGSLFHVSFDFRTGEWRQSMDDLRAGIVQRAKTANTPRQQQSESLGLIFFNHL